MLKIIKTANYTEMETLSTLKRIATALEVESTITALKELKEIGAIDNEYYEGILKQIVADCYPT